jgi:hypothetical protein
MLIVTGLVRIMSRIKGLNYAPEAPYLRFIGYNIDTYVNVRFNISRRF